MLLVLLRPDPHRLGSGELMTYLNLNVTTWSFQLKEIVMKDKMVFRVEELDRFWNFIAERQAIWHRRFVEASPQPWTKDLILQKNKFTNIYRELDPGTRYAMTQILEKEAPRPDRVFNIMMYRLMCSIPTYGGFGFHLLSEFEEHKFNNHLWSIYDSGEPVFGNAYLISPYSSMGSDLKYENVSRLFGQIHQDFEGFFRRLDSAPTMEKAFNVIHGMYGFGPFLAYQVLVDLLYPLQVEGGKGILPFSHNDWARLGPGAMRGFARLSSSQERLKGLKWLRRSQREEFDRLGIRFPFLLDDNGNRIELTLANLQNCLCEFHKYRSIQDGTGKAQRLFVPTQIRRY